MRDSRTRFATAGLAAVVLMLLMAAAPQAAATAPCDGVPYLASPQFDAATCRFRNPPNAFERPHRSGWAIWTRFVAQAKPPGTVPTDPIPVRPVTRAQLDALDNRANHLVRLGHSSFLLKLQGRYWLIDPMFGERASPFSFAGPKRFHAPPLPLDELPDIDGLVLSHDHYDHLDEGTIRTLGQRVQRYFVPLAVGPRLQNWGIELDRIQEFDWWQEARLADVTVTAVPAHHFSGRTLADRNSTLWSGWVIASGRERIFYSGDTGYHEGFAEIARRHGPFDIALMENGAYDAYWPMSHMTPEETVRAFKEVDARLLYLVHNSTFDLAFHGWREPLDRVAAIAEKEGLPLATPEVGEVLTLGQPRENRKWWEGLK